MASNKDLTAAIEARATELEIEFPSTEGLTNAELVALKKELDAYTPDADEAADEAEAPAPYTIAPGKAVTSLKGVVGEGKAVTAGHFTGGGETLAALVKAGLVIKA
jgi:hypothetical protein